MIPLFKVFMSEEAPKLVSEVLMSGWIGQGEKVNQFEAILRNFLNVEHLLTTNSGTSAEHLALHLLKSIPGKWRLNDQPCLEPGDTIVSTPLTCTATNWPILANGFKILWSDIDPLNLNVDLDDFEMKLISSCDNGLPPKVGVVVHWGGYPVDEIRLGEIRQTYFDTWGWYPMIIEDCAHAYGSRFYNRNLCEYGNICFYSFQAIKHLTCGDGGALVVNDPELLRRGKLLRWYGIDREDRDRKDFRCEAPIREWGFKFHMNDINATIGIANSAVTEWILSRHRENADYYNSVLFGIPGVKLLELSPRANSSYWLYTILVDNKPGFIRKMTEKGIQVSKVHERNDIHPCVSEFKGHLPQLDLVNDHIICIPVGWWVTSTQREHIASCIREGW